MAAATYKIYFAGELFSLKHLLGNAALADAIHQASDGSFQCVLPQALEQRDTTAVGIRNQDILTLLNCDVGVFNFDGDEIDSGTVVEYMLAKCIDMPTVIVRSDFRQGGDQRGDPWNLMLSFYPRSQVLRYDAMALYQRALGAARDSESLEEVAQQSVLAGKAVSQQIASEIVAAMRALLLQPSRMTPAMQQQVFAWMRLLPGGDFEQTLSQAQIAALLEHKRQCGVL